MKTRSLFPFVLSASALLVGCIPSVALEPVDPLMDDDDDDDDTGIGDDDDDPSGTGDEAPEGYDIRGRAVLPNARGGDCPFWPDSAPCTDPACQEDHMSAACEEIVHDYCNNVPDDPGCQGGPDDDDDDPGDPGDGETSDGETGDGDGDPGDGETGDGDGDPGDGDPGDGDPGDGDPGDGDPGEPEETYTPDSLGMLIYSVEFSTDAVGCADPILVGESLEPEFVDFFANPTLITADPPPPGIYPCIIITMSDHIRWTSSEAGPCLGEHTQDVASDDPDAPPDGKESQIRVYFSTAGQADSGSDHGVNAFEPPGLLLGEPHIAGANVAYSNLVTDAVDKVQMRWEGEGLVCDMQPPGMSFETVYVGG